jgi:transposase
MWTVADRERYGRDGLRYPSDLTDAEWALIAPLIRPAKRGGRRRSVVVRELLNGLLYVLETGCQWRHLPRDLPPRSTVHGYLQRWLQRWEWDGTLGAVHHCLYVACRGQAGGEAGPTAAILDSKSVRAAEKGVRRATRSVSTRARRSKGSSTTSSSTRSGCC